MEPVTHPITYAHQPTNISCGQTCVSMLASFYGKTVTPEEVMAELPMLLDDDGKEWGTFAVDHADWFMKHGFQVTMHVFDGQIVQQTWASLSREDLLNKLREREQTFVFPHLGKNLTKSFFASYFKFLEDGGTLVIEPYVKTSLLYDLLQEGPFIAVISYAHVYGKGISTHVVVVYGNDEHGNFLVADPWKDNAHQVIEPERLTGAIMAAQMTCENAVFQIHNRIPIMCSKRLSVTENFFKLRKT